MKKLLVIALAAIGVVACVKEEVALMPKGGAISFENAFISNSTRAAVDPSITTATLDGFNVWGFVSEYNGTIFTKKEVKKFAEGDWRYDGTQYWVPNKPYYFAALAPMNSDNWDVELAVDAAAKLGLGTVKFENINGTEDLLYAKKMVNSKGLNEEMESVKFQFQHLLSKVKFTFKNGFPTETASIKITGVEMEVPASAEIDLAQADYSKAWTGHAGTTTLKFGNVKKLSYTKDSEVSWERLTIPASASQEYNITFHVELFMGELSVYEVDMTSKVAGYELAMGHAYNFTAEIDNESLQLQEIVFDIEKVEDWDNTIQDEEIDDLQVALKELKSAATNGGSYTLRDDLDVTEPICVSGDFTLNLNGHKLYNSTDLWSDGNFGLLSVVGNGAKLTIEGDGKVEAKENDCYAIFVDNGGEVTINGGTIIGNIHAVYVSNNGGVANLNGGYYDIKQKYNATTPYRMLLNCGDTGYKSGISKIIVKGGEYVGFDPAHNDAEGANTSYVAAGYKSEQKGNNYVVVLE